LLNLLSAAAGIAHRLQEKAAMLLQRVMNMAALYSRACWWREWL